MSCANCHKDFCQCSRPLLAAAKARAAGWRTHGTAKKLRKVGLTFWPAPTPNVVIISKDGKPDVYLSLKPQGEEFKFRAAGKAWRRMQQQEFLQRMATAYGRPAGQVFPPACPKCTQRPEACICPPTSHPTP